MTPDSVLQFPIRSCELAEGDYREAQAERDGRVLWLVVTRHQGTPKAWLNVCPHQGRALNWAPDKFLVDPAGRLICAAHGAVFEPGAGLCIAGPCSGDSLRAVCVEQRKGLVHIVPDDG